MNNSHSLFKTVREQANSYISHQIKLRFFNALVIPIATYPSECWTLKAEDSRKLSVFENDYLRTMVGKRRCDRCRLVDIRRSLGVKDNILNMIKKRRLNWFGHVSRRDDISLVKLSYKEEFPGKRTRWRPKKICHRKKD